MNTERSCFTAIGAALAFCCMSANGVSVSAATPWITRVFDPTVIYGDDDRLDVREVQDPRHAILADSTVALFDAVNVALQPDAHTARVRTLPFGHVYRLCESEPFRTQPIGAFCSGSLIAPDVVLTAGHCIHSETKCASTRFVFGFAYPEQGAEPTVRPASEIYSCAEVIAREEDDEGADFALVLLDRPVSNHQPLALSHAGAPSVGSPLLVIGNPSGLPTKITGGGAVRRVDTERHYFVTNLDSYGGNSGSAVFNSTTLEIEGVLVRGERDFESVDGCTISNHCPVDGCRGEDVTTIERVIESMPLEIPSPS